MSEIMDIINDSNSMQLLNRIYVYKRDRDFKGNTLELILSFCEEYDLPLLEVGDILSDNKEFKQTFENTLVKDNYFQKEKTDNDVIVIQDDW